MLGNKFFYATSFANPSLDVKYFKSADVIVDEAGDALLVSQCKNYTEYHITFSRKIGDTCFRHFPVSLSYQNRTYFLEITGPRLIRSSPKLSCDERP